MGRQGRTIPSDNDQIKWLILRHIAENVQCVACHRSYAPEEVHILAHSDGLWVIRVACEYCGTEGLILVMVESRPSRPSLAALPDLSDRASPPPNQPALRLITEAEVEEIHQFLETYAGNFSEWGEA